MKAKSLCLLLFLVLGQSLHLFSVGHPILPVEPPGNGHTENDPYLVESLANLYWIAVETRNGNRFEGVFFLQTQDIDAAETLGWFDGAGWLPMGKFDHLPFSGTYNGGEHTISNLHINRGDEEDVSLFGYVSWASINHLGLLNASINGGYIMGGITGEADNSTISNCFVSGSVEGVELVGGLVGALGNSELNNSYNLSRVSGSDYIGGLVGDGWNYDAEKGMSYSAVTNSYSAGSIRVADAPEGNGVTKSGLQEVALNTRIPGRNPMGRFSKKGPKIGGVIGSFLAEGTIVITNSFWDVDKDGIDGTASGTDNYGATGKTTEEMQDINTFSDWDISPRADVLADYPFLAWELDENGEKADPVWIIGTLDPSAVPLSNAALYLSFLLVGGLVFFRIYRMNQS